MSNLHPFFFFLKAMLLFVKLFDDLIHRQASIQRPASKLERFSPVPSMHPINSLGPSFAST